MKITEAQLYAAINEFINREIMPLAATMDLKKQFIFGLKLGVVKYRVEDLVKTYLNQNEIKLLKLVDEDGKIDIEPIYKAALDAIRNVQKIEVLGITLNERDLQSLYNIMQYFAN